MVMTFDEQKMKAEPLKGKGIPIHPTFFLKLLGKKVYRVYDERDVAAAVQWLKDMMVDKEFNPRIWKWIDQAFPDVVKNGMD